MSDIPKLRADRLRLQKEIADALQELNAVYLKYVKPNAADARMVSGAPMSKGQDRRNTSATRVVTEAEAELLDKSTPTGAFEYGRFQMEAWGKIIASKRRSLKSVEDKLKKAQEDEVRRAGGTFADQVREQPAGDRDLGPARDPIRTQTGLPGDLAQRVADLRRMVHHRLRGQAGLSQEVFR